MLSKARKSACLGSLITNLKPPNDVFVPVNSEELKSKSVSYVMRPCHSAARRRENQDWMLGVECSLRRATRYGGQAILNRVAQSALCGLRLYFCFCPANAPVSPQSAEVGNHGWTQINTDRKRIMVSAADRRAGRTVVVAAPGAQITAGIFFCHILPVTNNLQR